ncbi:MAG: T9SS type A sorting domain-containing protein [Bacteroidota bacterium]
MGGELSATHRILWYQPNPTSLEHLSQDGHTFIEGYTISVGAELVKVSDPSGMERPGFLDAFTMLISDDASMEQTLTERQQVAIQAWLTSGEGSFFRLGRGEMPMASRSGRDEAAGWSWYHRIIHAALTTEGQTAEAWAGTNIPSLQVEIEHPSLPAVPHTLFACSQSEARVIALAWPSYWEQAQKAPVSPFQSPSIQHQLKLGLDWGMGQIETPPVSIHHLELSQYGKKGSIELSWQTDFEVLHDHFQLTKANAVGTFAVLDQIPAVGESAEPNLYFFLDQAPIRNFQLYQLKMHSQVGEVAHSPILLLSGGQTGPLVSLFPNPVQRELHVQVGLAHADGYELTIENEKGTAMLTQQVQLDYREQKQILDLKELGPGMYRVKISSEEGESMHAFVKH